MNRRDNTKKARETTPPQTSLMTLFRNTIQLPINCTQISPQRLTNSPPYKTLPSCLLLGIIKCNLHTINSSKAAKLLSKVKKLSQTPSKPNLLPTRSPLIMSIICLSTNLITHKPHPVLSLTLGLLILIVFRMNNRKINKMPSEAKSSGLSSKKTIN